MANTAHVAFKANDRSYFAILKKEIHAIAVSAGLSDKKVSETDLIVAELATNLVKHAGGGQLLVKAIIENDNPGIEIISIDNGRGMADVNKMISDGVSTKQTLGLGLGTIKRLADVFQAYSVRDWGSIIVVRVFAEAPPFFLAPPKTEIRSVVIPKPGEEQCGDGFYSVVSKEYVKLFLGDGLGHGSEAEDVIVKAGHAFRQCHEVDPVEIIRHINDMVRKTRGLVGTVAVYNMREKKWAICGVGNILTKIIGPSYGRNYLSYNGIIGLNVPKTLNSQSVPHEKGQHIIMCSDGIKSRWETIRYTGIMRHDLSLLCASLVKDFSRNTDDLSVVAAKIKS